MLVHEVGAVDRGEDGPEECLHVRLIIDEPAGRHRAASGALIPSPAFERELYILQETDDIGDGGDTARSSVADGPVIQRSTQAALTNGITLDKCLDAVRGLRAAGVTAPIVFLGYANPIIQKGEEAFAAGCAAAGADGVIVADLPPEEAGELRAACDRHGIALIAMLAPTSTERRIVQVAALATGFVYCVGLTGVTGARESLADDLGAYLDRVRAQVSVPVAVGFGISRPEHVAAVGRMADGVIVGSEIVQQLEELSPTGRAAGAARTVRWLKGEGERVLFVCSGNVGRSQMAAAFFNDLSPAHDALSAGIDVRERHGESISVKGSDVIRCMAETGIDMTGNVRKQLQPETLKRVDRVIALVDEASLPSFLKESPKLFQVWAIEDPYEQSFDFYRGVRDLIRGRVQELIRTIDGADAAPQK